MLLEIGIISWKKMAKVTAVFILVSVLAIVGIIAWNKGDFYLRGGDKSALGLFVRLQQRIARICRQLDDFRRRAGRGAATVG